MNLEISNYNQKLKKIIGIDVVISIVWFQYLQFRLQYHSSYFYEAGFMEIFWAATTNPTIIGIFISFASIFVCYYGLKVINEGRKLNQIKPLTSIMFTLWWGIFLPLELVTLVVYFLNITNLTTGLEVFYDLIQIVSDALREAFSDFDFSFSK